MSKTDGISRRRFLGTGMAAGSAILMASQHAAAAEEAKKDEKDDIRCGFIGIGGRGSGLLKAINKSPGVRVTALCDIKPENLAAAVKTVAADEPKTFTDYHEMLKSKDLDAVFIATPCDLHAPMAIAVLASGRHLYCEKPMAISVKDVNAVYAAAAKAKGIFQIGTQLRYAAPFAPALETITSGRIGKPVLVRAYRNNTVDFPANGWFIDPVRSGDVMLEQAVHEFDVFNAIFDGIPVRAAGFGGQAVRKSLAPMHDHFTLCLDYGPNKQVGYTHSWLMPPNVGCDGRNEFVYCTEGTVDMEGGWIYHREDKIVKTPAKDDKPAEMTNREPVASEPKGDSTQLAVNAFFNCCRKGEKPLANAETGRNAVLVGLICRKAVNEGRVVTMDEIQAEG